MDDKWTIAFNSLSADVRNICALQETKMRINQLMMEKARLKKHYEASLKEINDHIKNLEIWIREQT